MEKKADTRFPIHELLAGRWSPLAFSQRPVSGGDLGSLLEAARWAPSSYNEQPWSFLVGTPEDPEGLAKMQSCLAGANAAWANRAPLLILSVARLHFTRNGKENRHAAHDVGLAVSQLVLQAQALGLCAHQMAGFDAHKARKLLGIPDGHEPLAMIAVGYRAGPETLAEDLRARESAPRSRKEAEDFAFGAGWKKPL